MNDAKTPLAARAVALLFIAVTALTIFGFAARDWLPPVASEHGLGVDRTIRYLLIVTGVVFILGHGALALFVWRYSRPDAEPYRPVSPRTEWALALVPVIFLAAASEVGVLFMGAPVWAKVYGEPPADAVVVEVCGRQFEWLVRYPGRDGRFGRTAPELIDDVDNPVGIDRADPAARDDVVQRGIMKLPEGRAAVVHLRSHDVLHSFSIPELRVKQDIVPGLAGRTQFRPTRAGRYEIACAELCGLGHYMMRGYLDVLPPEEFDRWIGSR